MNKIDLNKLKLNGITVTEENSQYYAEISTSNVTCKYTLKDAPFTNIKVVLMDLDGTSVMSEEFWVYIIQKTMQKLMNNDSFTLSKEDLPFVSGYTTRQHLEYCINKYDKNLSIQKANSLYHEIASYELNEIMEGRGNIDSFVPRENLKDFLLSLKELGLKIGVVSSGLNYKALPEIYAAFRKLDMADPMEFYDALICGGNRKVKGNVGTIGEYAAKPHPWLYTEIGMSFDCDASNIVVMEDTAAGVISARLAGYNVLGMADGNLYTSGTDQLCLGVFDNLMNCFKFIKEHSEEK